jgi:hypothetical protein
MHKIRNICQLRTTKYSFDHPDCWKLFEYKLTLTEAECLSRVIKYLDKVRRLGETQLGESGQGESNDKLRIMAVECLSRAFKLLQSAENGETTDEEQDVGKGKEKIVEQTEFDLPIKLDNLTRSLETITEDIKRADELLNHTTQMV